MNTKRKMKQKLCKSKQIGHNAKSKETNNRIE